MDTLYQLPIFEGVASEEFAWLLANSSEVTLERGEYFHRENVPTEQFFIVLEGELQIIRTLNGVATVMGTTPRGIIGGEMALLYDTESQVDSIAIVPSRLMVFTLHAFRLIFSHAPTVGMRILRIAAERMAGVATTMKQQEKMAALGKFSAGLAHELNNPAAAMRRSAVVLREALPDLQAFTLKLNTLNLTPAQIVTLQALQHDALNKAAEPVYLTPMQRSDAEDEIADWLDGLGLANAWDMAPVFVGAGATLPELHTLVAALPDAPRILEWMCRSLSVAAVLDEIDQSSRRISDLVSAVKEYTYMDQAPLQEVDLQKGLDNTLKILNHKLKHIEVSREYDPEMPRILARGGELNQVWTNLIDNAIDALKGRENPLLRIVTRCENDYVMVEINDNGAGIPPEILGRIYEPFFTTKGIGEGTGLGLDITYRIIDQHKGTVEVRSEPGSTRFIVRLPRDPGLLD